MANSASDARASEQELRQKLIEARTVDVMVAVGPNMFYTVTLPCTLWFFDKGKRKGPRKDQVLFIDARGFYRQVSRAIRDFLPEQIEFLANIVRLWRGQAVETEGEGVSWIGMQRRLLPVLESQVFPPEPSPSASPARATPAATPSSTRGKSSSSGR